MITFTHTGDFSKLNTFFEQIKEAIKIGNLDKYGSEGVQALASATPKDTGFTADSWYYEIVREDERVSINFLNRNVVDGINIAIILQYGHGTGTGGYVQGRDYINPAIRPIFDRIAEDAWEEVTKN